VCGGEKCEGSKAAATQHKQTTAVSHSVSEATSQSGLGLMSTAAVDISHQDQEHYIAEKK